MKFAIVTGESKGLGESIASLFLDLGIHVIGISRTGNDHLSKRAEQNKVTFTHYKCDLADLSSIENTMSDMDEQLSNYNVRKIYLINNAAMLGPMNHSMAISNKELSDHFQVNSVAPMVLMNSLLKKSVNLKTSFIGVNITSGAADGAVYGWSAYCSSKASINMYTKTVALEQEQFQTNNNIIAFSPGVMDTEMQAKIRDTSREEFKDVKSFKRLKENNDLRNPELVGKILINILMDEPNMKNGKVYYVSDFL